MSQPCDAAAGTRPLADVLREATEVLRQAGVDSARLDAELLLAHALGFDRVQLYMHGDRPLEPAEVAAYRELVTRRADHEPVQYIVGVAYFRNLVLQVDQRVLIPRPETELLVEWALEHAARCDGGPVRVLDACTGSGAIAIAIAQEAPAGRVVVTGADVSPGALDVARANAVASDAQVELLEGDLLAPVAGRTFDVVVSNPPYIPRSDAPTLPRSVHDYEPHVALFVDGDDSLALARRIADEARAVLAAGGLLALEVGFGQHDDVADVLRAAGYVSVEVRADLQGIGRVVGGRTPA